MAEATPAPVVEPPAGDKPAVVTPTEGEGTPAGSKEALLADLAGERDRRQAAEKAAKTAQTELEKIQKASMSEQERAVAEARAEARSEALKEANERVLRSEIRAAASGKLADPSDAPALLGDLGRFIADNGEIDNKAISSAIGDLVKAKPYLAPAGRPGALPGGGAKPSEGVSMDDWLRSQARAKSR